MNICIVEDEKEQAQLLANYIKRYEEASKRQLHVTWLSDGMDIVDEYKGQFDIILLDIQMKHLDGMSAAEKIRQVDSDVVIIFITSTVQYAVQGYAVDALGYVLKPVPYVAFAQLLEKALSRLESRKKASIQISVDEKTRKIDCDTILYIESQRNNVLIHTENEDYITVGPLKRFDEMLGTKGFSKCHNAYLVNLAKVEAVTKDEVLLATGIQLPISRARKKEFLAELAKDII